MMKAFSLLLTCGSDEGLSKTQQDVLRYEMEAGHGGHLQNFPGQGLLHQRVSFPLQLGNTCHQH